MKKLMMVAVMAIATASVAMAQSGTGFPEALFGIGGAYALRLLKKKKNND